MDGLYLYCIREKTEGASGLSAGGIDGKKEAFTIVHRELEAVVSRVSMSKFASEEIRKRALEDLNWIKEKALAHESVIQAAMRGSDGPTDVIPMRFGIIFKDKTGLKETLERDYAKMRRLLNGIRGKQEWGIKVYLADSEAFVLMVKKENEEINMKEKEMASMPEGMAYFIEEELRQTVRDETDKKLDTVLDNLFQKLGEGAAESVKTAIVDREITGKTESMVLNAAFLVQAGKVDSFKNVLEDIDKDVKTKGLRLECSGPWPPFNFTHLGEEA